MLEIHSEQHPILSWCESPETGALEQARHLANLPFIHKHVCLMPDTHEGFGMPIGGVIGCIDVVVPNAVGVDIGCGMLACQTSLRASELSKKQLKKILGYIRQTIPVGFNHHHSRQDEKWMPDCGGAKQYPIITKEYNYARYQVGTLGGGNHFIEIQKDPDGLLWFMIHSGSRNLGKKVADYHNRTARNLNQKINSEIPPDWGLAHLPLNTQEARIYLNEMSYCLEFARNSRKHMAENIKAILAGILDVHFEREFDIHHNYANSETHFNKNVMVHRKGATAAFKDQIGIIPGSQGTPSYIVKGTGNTQSFKSCSHGAGRVLSRRKAREQLNLYDEQQKLKKLGIIHSLYSKHDLDEASGSYKNIEQVMKEQANLVSIVTKLQPLAVIKG